MVRVVNVEGRRRGKEGNYLGELDYRFQPLMIFCYSNGYEYSTSSKKADLEDHVSELCVSPA